MANRIQLSGGRTAHMPFRVRKRSGDYDPSANAIQIMAMKVSKGLEFPVVALPGVGHMPAAGEDEQEAARVFYVAATRATQRFLIGVSGYNGFSESLASALHSSSETQKFS
jgi:superfamily I DNA/RNA helicase